MTRKQRGFTMIELIVVCGLGSFSATLLIPAVQSSREAARRTSCTSNLKFQAIAMHSYHDVFRTFPPGWVQHSWDADEYSAWGWGTFLLPYLEEASRYHHIDFNVPPSQQSEQTLEAIMPPISAYRCPSTVNGGGWMTSNYALCFGSQPPPRWEPGVRTGDWPESAPTPRTVNGIAWCNSSCGIDEFTDGLSYTIMTGERSRRSSNALWLGVRGNQFEYDAISDLGRHSPINGGPGSFSSVHAGGAIFAFADGAVRFLSESVNDSRPGNIRESSLLEKLASRHDGASFSPEEYRLFEGDF